MDLLCSKLLRLGILQTFLSLSCTVMASVCLDYLKNQHVLAALAGGALFCSFCLTVCGIIEAVGGTHWFFRNINTKPVLFLVCVVESVIFVPGAIGFFGRLCYLINVIRRYSPEASLNIDFPVLALAVISPVAGLLAFMVFGITMCTAAILHYHESPACLQVHAISYNPEACEQPLIVCTSDIEDSQDYLPSDIAFDQSFARRPTDFDVPLRKYHKIR
ncbi:uncharacterized protein LOC115209826 [Octopus sinensis]|uniref:Uncharacterized protein LOC115209826 n=1 Tax=Octopus sinensis TaxID=2607531 RepID=A0A6P7S7R8_9MOLL|nr:uncharacterized protein LOC115209826 [Octopus sinensis]